MDGYQYIPEKKKGIILLEVNSYQFMASLISKLFFIYHSLRAPHGWPWNVWQQINYLLGIRVTSKQLGIILYNTT